MYLQQSYEYHSVRLTGQDKEGNLYKGEIFFMIVGLKKSIPYVIKAIPETSITGDFIKDEIEESLNTLRSASFNIRALIADNHQTNVSVYSKMLSIYGSDKPEEYIFIT